MIQSIGATVGSTAAREVTESEAQGRFLAEGAFAARRPAERADLHGRRGFWVSTQYSRGLVAAVCVYDGIYRIAGVVGIVMA